MQMHLSELPICYTRCTRYQLHGIGEDRLRQSTDSLPERDAQLFRRKAQQRRQRHNGEEVCDEYYGWVILEDAQHNTNRHENQHDVDVIADKRPPRESKQAL